MNWLFAGFISAVLLEMFMRVLSGYEPETRQKQRRVQVSFPWYLTGGAAYLATRKRGK